MVAEMERLPYAFGTPEATYYFLRDFDDFEETINDNEATEDREEMTLDLTSAAVSITDKAEWRNVEDHSVLPSEDDTFPTSFSPSTVRTTSNSVKVPHVCISWRRKAENS